MGDTEATNVASELIDAFSAGDWTRFRATLDPDVDYEETGTGRRTVGADAYVALCQGWRDAFPDCVAYGFFPQRHQTLYDTWPLIHSNDERIDVRDLGFAASFFHELPRRLLS